MTLGLDAAGMAPSEALEQKPGRQRPWLIVDATSWPGGGARADALFAGIRNALFSRVHAPLTLVLTDEQYDRLPRSFDDLVECVRVQDHEQGWARIQDMAREHGLVLSSRRFEHFERWLAAEFDGKQFLFEPANGLELFQSTGRLPGLEQVSHPLSDLVPEAMAVFVPLPGSPLALRRLMQALTSEQASAELSLSPAQRQAQARKLGITATSTARERLEAELQVLSAELSLPLTPCSQQELTAHLARAARRPTGPLVLHVGDSIHLLNVAPDAAARVARRPGVQVHDIRPTPTPLGRILEAVSSWTEGDFLADPFLEHLLARLDASGRERPGFLHARAGLLLTQAIQPKPASFVTDWRSALAELLAGDPPAAWLRVRIEPESHRPAHSYGSTGLRFPPFLVVQEPWEHASKEPLRELHQFPPVTELMMSRQDALLCVMGGSTRSSDKHTQTRLPTHPEAARNASLWLDAFEVSSAEPEQPVPGDVWSRLNGKPFTDERPSWNTVPLPIPSTVWQEADLELALAWSALRLALSKPQFIPLPDGAVLLRVGGAFFAEIRIIPRADTSPYTAPVRAGLLLRVPHSWLERSRQQNSVPPSVRHVVVTHSVGRYDVGALLPEQLCLLGTSCYASIRFRASALFSDHPSDVFPAIAAAPALADDEDD